MINAFHKPDSSLEYIIKDCQEAISANPLGYKTEQYLATARACQKELNRRQSVRIERKMIAIPTDTLQWRTMPGIKPALKSLLKHWKQANAYDIDKSREGALSIGLRKIHLK
jgi:hypothetical protein